jgi:hypothetical protein
MKKDGNGLIRIIEDKVQVVFSKNMKEQGGPLWSGISLENKKGYFVITVFQEVWT